MTNLTPPIKRAGFIEFDKKEFKEPPPDGTEWRCKCTVGDLFGIFKQGVLHIKYRERDLFVPEGIVRCRCRRCGNESVIDIGAQGVGVTIVYSANENYLEELRDTLIGIDATDAALKLAHERGIDLKGVQGSGKDGRITKGDVEELIELP